MAWQRVQLGELATFRNGLNFNAADRGPGVAVVGIPDFYDASFVDYRSLDEVRSSVVPSEDALLKIGDILFVRSNGNRELIGRSLLVKETPPKPTSHSGFTIRLRFVDRRAHPLFFAYLLRSETYRRRMSSQGGGTSINNLNQGILSRLEVPLPCFETQRRIAAILGAYDDLIEVNRRRVAVLEEMARGLFEEWFFRFRFPGHEDVPIVETPDGPLPEGWEFLPLQDFLVLQRGFDLPKSKRGEGEVPVFSASGYHGGHNEHRVVGPGVVTGRSGTIGQVHLVWNDFWPLNTTLYVREFRRAGPVVAFLLLQRLDLANHASGAAVPTLNRNHVHGIKLPAPPAALAARFEAIASPMFRAARNLELENAALAASRDLLLPRLISGQLCVEAAERELERAA